MKHTQRRLEQIRNGYDHHHHHHQQQHHSIHDQKSVFLPMFCRLSIKDVKLNNHYKDPISAAVADPSSPKVSCIGQVKRNNRVIGFPPPSTTTATSAANHHKHTKLKSLFSSKTLLPNTTTAMNATTFASAVGGGGGGRNGARSSRTSKEMCVNNSRRSRARSNCDRHLNSPVKVVDIGEMDPPLPVVKRVAPPPGVGRDEVNIWKRRFNGAGLKSLQIEQIHSPNGKFETQPITTV